MVSGKQNRKLMTIRFLNAEPDIETVRNSNGFWEFGLFESFITVNFCFHVPTVLLH